MNNIPLILSIDTSCDDTSVAIVRGRSVLSSVVSSQVEIHAKWGGVVPDIARREHEKNLPLVYSEALNKAHVTIQDIEYIAVTYGPGLAIDLEVGINFAKELSLKYSKPLIPVNHMEGHLLSGLLLNSKGHGLIKDDISNLFPALGVLLSGKHTEIIYIEDIGKYTKLGETLDDAVGEAFDKVARMLDFGYPGGPVVTEFAKRGKSGKIVFPIPMKSSNDLNFSYSGLKTAALYMSNNLKESGASQKEWVYDFCRGFLDAVKESLRIKIVKSIESNTMINALFVGGGVVNSEEILRYLGGIAKEYGLRYVYPEIEYRGDNAGMVGIVGYCKSLRGEYLNDSIDISKLDREPRLSL